MQRKKRKTDSGDSDIFNTKRIVDEYNRQIKDLVDEFTVPINSGTPKIKKDKQTISEAKSEPSVKSSEPKLSKKNEFDSILLTIKERFHPLDSRDETELEKQLFQILNILYPNRSQRQVPTSKGRIDILIDNKYGLELKIANSSRKLRDLKGQVYDYKKVFTDVAVILLNINKLSQSDMDEFVQDCEKLGVKTIIIDGQFKPQKRKGTDIHLQINK